jgi:hypothetical protein
MFCNNCGGPIQPDYQACPQCGKMIQGPATAAPEGRVARHITVVATLWIVMGCLWLIPAFIMIVLGSVAHAFIPMSDAVARNLGPFVLHAIGIILFFIGLGGVLVGWGLLKRRAWARIVTIVLGFIALLHPPFATALGIYTLWVLLPSESEREYLGMAEA